VSEDKPLHVKVAEALGLKPKMFRVRGSADLFVEVYSDNRYWLVDGQHSAQELAALAPPHYDTDWSATGPLIERLNIKLHAGDPDNVLPDHKPTLPKRWFAESNLDGW
jgi:hypothetical protein